MAQALRTSLQAGGLTQGGLRPGLGGDNIFATSALDLNFGMTKSLGGLVTFTRASSGTYVGSDGVLKTATTNLLLRSEEFGTSPWSTASASVTANSVTAPNGTVTADTLVRSGTSSARVVQGVTVAGTNTLTVSVYAKAGTQNFLAIQVNTDSNTKAAFITFDLTTGAAGASQTLLGVLSLTASQVVNVGDGWYRCACSFTGVGGADVYVGASSTANSRNGTDGGTIYLWGAQLEQSSTVGEYIPTTSTINSAPRFDHAITSSVTNFKAFSNAILVANAYGVNNSTLTTVTTATPVGSATASLFTLNAGANTGNNADGFNFGSGITLVNSTQHTQSLFVKPANATVLRLRSNTSGLVVDFTLTGNGTTPSLSAELQGASIVPLDNGWYRVSWTFTTTTSVPGNRGDYWTVKTNVADGASGLYVVGAQLEQSSTVGTYVPTTTAAATSSTTESLGLLVEEQRTNLCTQSEDFSSNQASNNVSISANQIAAPDGTVAADLVTSTLAGSSNTCWVQQIASIAASTSTYTSSFYAKQGTSPSVTLNVAFTGGTYTEIFVRFDFSTKSVSIGGGGAGAATAGYQQLQNGWFRIWAAFPNNNTGTAITHRIYTRSEGTTNVVGDSVYLWGRMTEAGASPTSYIPTTTATATRSADVASITGANFSSWYRQDEGSFYASFSHPVLPVQAGARIFAAANSTATDQFWGRMAGGVSVALDVSVSGASQAAFSAGNPSANEISRAAIAARANDFFASRNGTGYGPDVSGAMPSALDRLGIGLEAVSNGSQLNGHIRRLTYWPQRLPNSTLQTLTQ